MDSTEKLVFGGGALLLLLLVGVPLVDLCTMSDRFSEPVTVVSTSYTPSQTQTGIAHGSRPAVVTTTSSEEWSVVVRTGDGRVVASQADRQAWADLKPGDAAHLVHRKGVFLLTSTRVSR